MTPTDVAVLLVLVATGALVCGLVIGSTVERRSWLVRAETRDTPYGATPHHADGRFYFVIEEGHFLETYARKETAGNPVPPQGGTAPPRDTPPPFPSRYGTPLFMLDLRPDDQEGE